MTWNGEPVRVMAAIEAVIAAAAGVALAVGADGEITAAVAALASAVVAAVLAFVVRDAVTPEHRAAEREEAAYRLGHMTPRTSGEGDLEV